VVTVGLKAKLIASLPKATVAACQSDYRTPAQQKQASDEAKLQREEATVSGNAAGSRWHGRKP
jgi:hypothetical protein